MSDTELLLKFHTELGNLAGPGLPNSFEEAFVWHIALGKTVTEAYVAAGYLGAGDVEKKAWELLKREDVASRHHKAHEALGIMIIRWGPFLLKHMGPMQAPLVDPNDLPA